MDDVSTAPRVLSFQLLNEITNSFSEDMKIGAGSYGNVYKGEHTNGEMIAVKLLHNSPGLDDEQFEKEYHNLASLQHKNIVRLVGYCHETQREFLPYNGKMVLAEMTRRALCFEYMQNGSLDSFLTDESSGDDWRTRYAIIKGICQGLKYLHEELRPPMYHLDLKPANVLLDDNMVPKIADFGLSRLFGGEQTKKTKSSLGTPGYVPPEYIDAGIISIKYDIFSLGVVIIKIMTGPTGYFRISEMSPQEFIELVHANWKSKLQTTSVYRSEPYCKQVKSCIEIALSCVDGDRHKRPSIGVIINMLNETEGMGPTPIKPGSVQLAIKSTKVTPFKQKVMLELTGGDYTSDRPGLDLVAILDINIGMHGRKMDQLKIAMRFIIQKLSPIDRLSIVTFSNVAKTLCPLRQITEASQQELQGLIISLMDSGRVSNIEDGLLTGLKVLADRKVSSGRIVGIMLMSNGLQSIGDATQVTLGNVPVYTFGFGAGSNAWMLSEIAANSMGGTFSHVQDIGNGRLAMAFSQCLAGLLTVAVQNLELTVAAVGDKSTVLKVTAGNYTQRHDTAGSVSVSFGDLYSREVRNIIVDLLLPTIDGECSGEILKVTYSYSSSSFSAGRLQFVAPPETLTVWRTSMEVSVKETQLLAKLQMEEVRVRTAKMIKEACTSLWHTRYWLIQQPELEESQRKLVQTQNMLEKCDPLLRMELLELLELCKSRLRHVLPYALSSKSSHDRQRFAARGRNMENMRFFVTPRMDMYLEQAKKFCDDPMIPLPSADDDVKEEVGALTVNVASREEGIRRLSEDVEDLMDAYKASVSQKRYNRK